MFLLKLLFLQAQRLALLATIDGQMQVLTLPLDREYRTRVMLAHASAEVELLNVDAEIRKLQRGTGLQAFGV